MRLSVRIPCYNAGSYLAEAIESVLAQQTPVAEIVLVDDGSTDDSAEVARRYGDRVRVHRQEQRGIAAARNRCLDLSRGDCIAYLDADDWWPAGSLGSRLARLQSDPGPGIVFGLVQQFVSPELPEELRKRFVCPPEPQAARLAGSMVIHRSVFDRIGGFDEQLGVGETIDWAARADAAGIHACQVDQVVLHRRLHRTNSGTMLRHRRSDLVRALGAAIRRRRAMTGDTSPDNAP